MSGQASIGRMISRATPAVIAQDLPFMGASDAHEERPVVYAKVLAGESKKAMKQAASVQGTLSIDEAKHLRDAIAASQPGAQSIFKAKGCPGMTQDSFAKIDALKGRLDNFLSTAKTGNTFPVTSEDLDLMDKMIACAIQAQKQPDTWAYVVLGTVLAGTVLAVSLSEG
jgi:hypothetical protein